MIGTILGDLAACRYENGEAELSPLGKVAMSTALQVIEYSNAFIVPSVNKYCSHQDSLIHRENAVKVCQVAWSAGMVSFGGSPTDTMFYDDKAGMYFYWIMGSVLDALIHGCSKREALNTDGGKYLAGVASSGLNKSHAEDLLGYAANAWTCFSNAWDFKSAIDNALKWNCKDRHLLCCLTGALADAMYGCESVLDEMVPEKYRPDLARIFSYQFEHRHFFPKASAAVAVKKNHFAPAETKVDGMFVSTRLKDLFLRSREKSSGDKYGFFLDNGWVYSYMAGGNVIGRFRFEEGLFDTWRIIDVQEVNHDGMMNYTLPEGMVSMEKLLKYICKTAQ